MRVFHHHPSPPNVGDDLNRVIWPRLVPELRDLDTADWLVGAGTIVDHRLANLNGRKVVMGSGVRCDSRVRRFGDDVRFAGVRGSLSARWLGLPDSDAIGDPGFVFSRWVEPGGGGAVGLVPHVHTLQWSSFAERAADAGLSVISPTLPLPEFIPALRRCARVFCESLHGAILAEALRIPWARVRVCAHHYEGAGVSEFKWRDAFSVLGNSVEPSNAVGLAPVKRSWPATHRALRPLQRAMERRLARRLGDLRDELSVFRLAPTERLHACVDRFLDRVARLQSTAGTLS